MFIQIYEVSGYFFIIFMTRCSQFIDKLNPPGGSSGYSESGFITEANLY